MADNKDIRPDTPAEPTAIPENVLSVLKADGHLTKAENDYIKANFLKDTETISAFANDEVIKMIHKDYAVANETYLGGPAGIVEMQRKLKAKGYKEVFANGVFTKETFFALVTFQKSAGLTKIDGIAGEETQRALGMTPREAKATGAGTAGPKRKPATGTADSATPATSKPADATGSALKRRSSDASAPEAAQKQAAPAAAPSAPASAARTPAQEPTGKPTVESAPLVAHTAFFRDGAYYVTGPKWTPVLVETGDILKNLGIPKEAGENYNTSRMRLESIGFMLEGLLQKFPKDREAILEAGKMLETLARAENVQKGQVSVTLDDGLFGEKWKKSGNVSKFSKDLLRIANASPEKWLLESFAFVRNELGQYSMVGETLISRQWEKAIGNIDDEALSQLLENRRLGKDVSQEVAFTALEEHLGKDTINKMLDKANSAGIDANTKWEKNLGTYLAEFKAQYPGKDVTTEDLEKSRIAFRKTMTISEAKKYLLGESLKNRAGAFSLETNDPELKMLSEILGSAKLRLSDRQADMWTEIATFLAVEAIAVAAGVVTAGVGTWAVNAIAFGRHASRGKELLTAYNAAGTFKRGAVTAGRLVGGGIGFEAGAAGIRSKTEGENMYSKEGFAQAIAMNVVLHGLGRFFLSKEAPGFLKTKEGAKIWENRIPLASQIAIEGTAIGLTAGTVGTVFFEKDHLWSAQEMGQAILMAGLFRGARSIKFSKAKNGDIVATPEGWAESVSTPVAKTTPVSTPAGAPGTPEFVGPRQPFVGPPAPISTPMVTSPKPTPNPAPTPTPVVAAKPAVAPQEPSAPRLRSNGLPELVEGGKVVPLPEGKRGYKTPDGKVTEIPQSEVRYYSGLPPVPSVYRNGTITPPVKSAATPNQKQESTPLEIPAVPETPAPRAISQPVPDQHVVAPPKKLPAASPVVPEPKVISAPEATPVVAKPSAPTQEPMPTAVAEEPLTTGEIPAFLIKGSPESAAFMESSARRQAEIVARGPYAEPSTLPNYPVVKPFKVSRDLEAASYSSRGKAPTEIPAWLLKDAKDMATPGGKQTTATTPASPAVKEPATRQPAAEAPTTESAGSADTASVRPAYSKKEARQAGQQKAAEEREFSKRKRERDSRADSGKNSVPPEGKTVAGSPTENRLVNELDTLLSKGEGTSANFEVSRNSKWQLSVRWSGWNIDQFDDGTYSLQGKVRNKVVNGEYFPTQKDLIEFLRLPE